MTGTVKFSEGRREVSKLKHGHILPTAVCNVNIPCVKKLILGKRSITVCDTASNSGMSVSVETNIHEHILFKKACDQWVPTMFTFNQKVQQVAACTQHRHWFELEGNTILELVTDCEKIWCSSALQSQSCPAQIGITSDFHHPKKIQGTPVS
jgi:hypothetical protein